MIFVPPGTSLNEIDAALAEHSFLSDTRVTDDGVRIRVYGRIIRKNGGLRRTHWNTPREITFDREGELFSLYPFWRCMWVLWRIGALK